MRNKQNKIFLFILILSITSSCTLSPRYKRENTPSLNSWKESFPETIDAEKSSNFWKIFNDDALNQLVVKALQNNQDIKIAIETVNTFIAKLGVTRSRLFPQIQGNGIAMKEKVSPVLDPIPTGGTMIGNIFDAVFNVSYLADIWGEIRSATQSAYHQFEASIEARKSVVLTVVSSTVTNYFLLRQYDAQLIIARETLESRVRSYELALIRYQLGLTSKLQVEQSLSEVEDAKIEVENISIGIGEIEDLLSVLIGEPTTSIPRGLSIQDLVMPKEVLNEAPSQILSQRPDIMENEQLLIAANAEIGVAKSKFFPQFNLLGSYGYESGQLSTLFQNSSSIWGYGISIIQEIFTGGRLTSNLKLTEAEKRKRIYVYHQSILNAFREVNDALVRYRYYNEQIGTQKVRVEALSRYLNIASLQYKEGQIDYLNYLDAERKLFQAQLSQVQTIAQSFIAFVDIYKAMGGSWVNIADQSALKN